jgi:hypothetical protein
MSRNAADRGGSMGGVPTISRFVGISIAMFFDDHGPPHFHARHAEGGAKVRIDSLEVIESNLPRRQLRFVLAWAELRQDELRENWRARALVRHSSRSSRSDDWPDARHHRGRRDPPRRSPSPLRRWAER